MASKRGVKRRARRHECGSKARHPSERGAWYALSLIRDRGPNGRMGVYRCPHCGFWHVGHTPRRLLREAS